MSFIASCTAKGAETGTPLASPAPLRDELPLRPWLLCGLLLLTLLPRALMAWRLEVVCEDGPIYIEAAQHIEAGEIQQAFAVYHLRLNLFPAALACMHRLGFDWATTGELWGVAVSSLAVLPLFGWVRRQFDDRVALISCALYAVHPALIERSPEILRCPTYWLLLTTTLYFLWRGAVEVRARFYLAAGLTVALAVHTRFEGWFLLVPCLLWSAWRFRALQVERWRLAVSTALCAAMIPLFMVAINVTWLRNQPQWEICFSNRIELMRSWLETPEESPDSAGEFPGAAPAPQVVAATPRAADRAAPPAAPPQTSPAASRRRLAGWYVIKMVDAFDYVIGSLTLAGLWRWRRTFFRRDQQAVCLMSLVNMSAIAVFLINVQDFSERYFFPVVIVSFPYAAMSLDSLAVWVVKRWAAWSPAWHVNYAHALASLLTIVGVVGCADALTNDYESREVRRELGQWLADRVGDRQMIVGSEPRSLMTAYYARGRYYGPGEKDLPTPEFRAFVAAERPAAVVVWPDPRWRGPDSPWTEWFQREPSTANQFERIPPEQLPPACRGIAVLVRKAAAVEQLAKRQSSAGRH